MPEVDRRMQQALADGVFPGAVLLAARGGELLVHGAYGIANTRTRQPVTPTTIFDLASLTKPLATTLAAMLLCQQGRLEPDQYLAALVPAAARGDKREITIAQLLAHTSGLPDYRPYYRELALLPESERRSRLRQLLLNEPLLHPPGTTALYSDLGFMLLEWVVESAAGQRIDRFLAQQVYAPLQAAPLFFIDRRPPALAAVYAATEECAWRGHLIDAEVHDENAHALGGIAGHAGLFGTAAAVHTILAELLAAYHGQSAGRLFRPEVVRRFWQPVSGAGKTLGFDLPAAVGPSCGRFFPPDSIGHLGFTGTSFWIHRAHQLSVILLTNRVHPSRDNIAIRQFRPQIHDAVMQALLDMA
jgi:CubicO group peptidase (beta-lactamase class C family)